MSSRNGGGSGGGASSGADERGRGGKRSGRGRGRGGGGPHSSRPRRAADYTPVLEPRADQATIGEAARLAMEKADKEKQEAANAGPDGEPDNENEPDTCYICAEPIKYYVLGTCSHRTCHVCSLRLRALYKKKECTFCKLELPTVICTLDGTTAFQDFPPDAFPYSDAKLGIAFETSEMMEDNLTLLRFNCPQLDCDYLGTSWMDLKKHVRTEHSLHFCDLCIKHKKIFSHEHSLFTSQSLQTHIKEGDPVDSDTGFTGHPSCEFCRITFYDNDQLFAHCRDRHEQCFICIRNGTGRYQYYVDYPHLETHFQAQHYLCLNPQCLEQRFIVFDNEIDLQSHQLSTHGGTSGRTARKLETNFTYAPSHDPRAGGGVLMQPRRQRPAASTSNISVTGPSTSAAPVATPEPGPSESRTNGVVGSRGRIVPGMQRGGFNTSLSDAAPPTSRKAEKRPTRDEANMAETVTGIQQTDPVMAARHASLLTRVSEAVHGSESKLAAYRAAIRAYRSSESSAVDCIRSVHALLDDQIDLTGRIITSTADLLDKPDKRIELLNAWNDYQVNLTQSVDAFPSLVATAPTSHGVLMTGPSSRSSSLARSTVSRAQKQSNAAVWARVEQAAANKNVGAVPGLTNRVPQHKDKFPALPAKQHAVSSHAGVRGSTPWASSRQQMTSPDSTYFPKASSAASSLVPSRTASPVFGRPAPVRAVPASEFPALPNVPAAKARAEQKAAIFGKKEPVTSPKPWGAASPPLQNDGLQQDMQSLQLGAGSSTPGLSGKKKKGKQVLLHYGL